MISSRTLLLFLIALNLLALAWWTGAMEPLVGSAREPGRLDSQIEPDSLRVTSILADNQEKKSVPARVASDGAVRPDPGATVATGQALAGSQAEQAAAQNTALAGTSDFQGDSAATGSNPALADAPGTSPGNESTGYNPGQLSEMTTPGPYGPDAGPNTGPYKGPYKGPSAPVQTERTVVGGPQLSAAMPAAPDDESGLLPVAAEADPAGQGVSDSAIDKTEAGGRVLPEASWQQKSNPGVDGLPLVSAALSDVPTPSAPDNALSCAEFSSLSYIEAREVEDELAPYGVKTALSRIDKGDFLVYIEPMSSVQLARRKFDQLKRLGVRDLHVIRAGYYRNGISLGMLRNYDLANRHKEQMTGLGVTTMRIGPVNARGSRYKLTARALPATMDSIVSRHEVLTLLDMQPCQ